MKIIVQNDEKIDNYLVQIIKDLDYLSPKYKIINIKKNDLIGLSKILQYIEANFTIELCQMECLDQTILSHNFFLITIGSKNEDNRIDARYNMLTHTLEKSNNSIAFNEYQWIHCYSRDDKIEASEYIKCIRYFMSFLSYVHKPTIIYANIFVPQEVFRYRTLTYKIISSYIDNLNGVFIAKADHTNAYRHYALCEQAFEFYSDKTLYLQSSINDAIKKVIPFLHASPPLNEPEHTDENPRQPNSLYANNVFYQSIPLDQEIYVPLSIMSFRDPSYYRSLGLKYISLIGNYGVLYASRRQFDALSEVLRSDVAHPYYNPVLSHQFCHKDVINDNFSYHLTSVSPKYKGEGIYIGVISADPIDYTNSVFRMQDGKSRIACIWEQINSDEGMYHFTEQIDEALASPTPDQFIKLPDADSISTMILGIAGGESYMPDYRGIATEAEFVVATINTAPETYQKIYGGTPAKEAVTMADILVGITKLINFASIKKKPLVLCIPFNTNIDSHDGSLVLSETLGILATKEGVTIIVPTGEEADKMHHYGAEGTQPSFSTIELRVIRENQNIIGIAYQRFSTVVSALLYPPPEVGGEAIDLKIRGVTRSKDSVIYSNGYNLSPLNGAIRLLFRIDNPHVGIWRIELTLTTETSSQIDLWISQQELNKYVTLTPSSPLITIGSLGNIRNLITVGGYDADNMVVLRSSGRGYSWDNRVEPNFVTHAANITAPCQIGEWVNVTGTLPAAGIMLGVVAAMYNRCIKEQVSPLPNTMVMDTLVLGTVKQFEGIEYPNPSSGYGVFDLQALDLLLSNPLIL
ncbi:hypothetical protein [Cellulosilyticum sp. I15G10I2]|uniref:hypothetical protein n=1 Tax=Cellulosilyticum sp. I15G10I2 TaxID=1892843 RepID=UPI00085C2916|nr:hypothetical protein [Cellulosilyticum sp. I15G10I2]